MLDDGISQTFLKVKATNELNLIQNNSRNISVRVLGGNMSTMSTSDIQFQISAMQNSKD